MKKLFFGLATLLFCCFFANNVNAQVDTLNRNNGNSGQLKMPADTSRQDTSNKVKPIPRPLNPLPQPLPNVPDSPMPNIPMNPPPVPTTGAPIG